MTKSKFKRIILTAIIGAVAVLFSGCSNEEAYRLVKVNSFEGEVSVQREEKLDAFEGLQLVSEDSVSVGDKSFLELLADSDKHIAAEENTGFTLHSTGNEESGSITIELIYGKALFSIDNKLNDSSSFDVNTPNATLSVRGTSFSVAYNPEEEKTEVEVFEGKVRLASHGKVSYLEKGDSATVKTDDENGVVVSEGISSDNNEGNNEEQTATKTTENLFGIAMSYSGGSNTASKAEYITELSDYTKNKAGVKENDAAFKKFTSIIKKHSADVDKFFNDNKADAIKNLKQTDITEWFTDNIPMGDKTVRIDKAVMSIVVDGGNTASEGKSDEYKTSLNGREIYYKASGAAFEFYGDFDTKTESAVTTATTTKNNTNTTSPVSEDSSDLTTEPVEIEQEETVSTPAVTTVPGIAAPATTKATTTTKKETTTTAPPKSNSIKMQEVVSGRIVYVSIPSGYKLWEYDAADYKSEGKLYGALLVPTKKGKYNISVTFESGDPMKTLVKKGKADYDGSSYKVVDSYKCSVNSSKTGTVYIAERVGGSNEYLLFVECVSGETEYLILGMEDEDGNAYDVMTKYLYGTTKDIKKFAKQMFPAK